MKRSGRPSAAEEPEVELELEDEVLDDEDADEEFIEDAGDIGGDEVDIVGVIDVEEGGGEKE